MLAITIQLELEVGRQLARMLGLNVDPKTPWHWGTTLGGTVANDEALARTVGAALPLARDASEATGLDPGPSGSGRRTDAELLRSARRGARPARRASGFCASEPSRGRAAGRSPRLASRTRASPPSLNVIPR
jgi:hypothetical protein